MNGSGTLISVTEGRRTFPCCGMSSRFREVVVNGGELRNVGVAFCVATDVIRYVPYLAKIVHVTALRNELLLKRTVVPCTLVGRWSTAGWVYG